MNDEKLTSADRIWTWVSPSCGGRSFRVRLTDTGRSLCSEARLTPALEAASSVHARVPQLAATQRLQAALVHVYRAEGARTIRAVFGYAGVTKHPVKECSRGGGETLPIGATMLLNKLCVDVQTHISQSCTPDVNVSLTCTACSIKSHYISRRARAGEGPDGVSAFSITPTGPQARHCSQRTLVYICNTHTVHMHYEHTTEHTRMVQVINCPSNTISHAHGTSSLPLSLSHTDADEPWQPPAPVR